MDEYQIEARILNDSFSYSLRACLYNLMENPTDQDIADHIRNTPKEFTSLGMLLLWVIGSVSTISKVVQEHGTGYIKNTTGLSNTSFYAYEFFRKVFGPEAVLPLITPNVIQMYQSALLDIETVDFVEGRISDNMQSVSQQIIDAFCFRIGLSEEHFFSARLHLTKLQRVKFVVLVESLSLQVAGSALSHAMAINDPSCGDCQGCTNCNSLLDEFGKSEDDVVCH